MLHFILHPGRPAGWCNIGFPGAGGAHLLRAAVRVGPKPRGPREEMTRSGVSSAPMPLQPKF